MTGLAPLSNRPQIGDLVAAEILSVGRNRALEGRTGVKAHLFPDDVIVGAFGNRYATDQYEGYVPDGPTEVCDLLSAGGVIGEVASQNAGVASATRLGLLGAVCDRHDNTLNQRQFGLPAGTGTQQGQVILVVGSAMNSGKTTTVGSLARALRRFGFRVGAAKVTGTAAGKDARFYRSCGARPAYDFTDAGYPSTYLLDLDELLEIHNTLVSQLRANQLDYVIVEIADGIFQRETRMMLESVAFRDGIDHVVFAAGDSLSIECGARCIRDYGLPLRATSGSVTTSPLATLEAEEASGLPCLSINRMLAGEVLEIFGVQAPPVILERPQPFALVELPV